MQAIDATAPTPSSNQRTSLCQLQWQRIAVCYAAGGLLCVGLWLAAGRFLADPGAVLPATVLLANGGSNLVVAETDHDLGQVTAETVVRHEFRVRNRGNTRIVLNEETCCGDATSRILPPGGQLAIPVVLDTKGRIGRVQQSVTVTTSDPAWSRIHFTLTARVAERS